MWGHRVLRIRPLRRHEERLDRARTFLRERGAFAVFLGRWTAFLRAVMPGLAGLSRMPYRRFLFYNALGGIAWGTTFCLVGYLAGNSYEAVANRVGVGGAVVSVAILVALLVGWRVRGRILERRSASAGRQPHRVPEDEKVPGHARRHP